MAIVLVLLDTRYVISSFRRLANQFWACVTMRGYLVHSMRNDKQSCTKKSSNPGQLFWNPKHDIEEQSVWTPGAGYAAEQISQTFMLFRISISMPNAVEPSRGLQAKPLA